MLSCFLPWRRSAPGQDKASIGTGGAGTPAPDQQTPEVLAAHQKAEMDKWWPLIKSVGIKPD